MNWQPKHISIYYKCGGVNPPRVEKLGGGDMLDSGAGEKRKLIRRCGYMRPVKRVGGLGWTVEIQLRRRRLCIHARLGRAEGLMCLLQLPYHSYKRSSLVCKSLLSFFIILSFLEDNYECSDPRRRSFEEEFFRRRTTMDESRPAG